ncbi:MAG: FeoB-associated Cys-rich membrane protein [Clostridia bacterium]|nr:FeoB-associated Cys-rich membrane protein [Clostridia bacterium]
MWFVENLGSIAVGLVLIAIVTFIIVSNIKGKKKGKSNCGCGCSSCSMNGICHKAEENK